MVVVQITKRLKILICAQEYPPEGSGIAYLIYNQAKAFRKLGHNVDIVSPTGPDYKIKDSFRYIKKFGGLGVAYFWKKTGNLLKRLAPKYDLIYLHNPMLFTRLKNKNIRCLVHTLFYFSFKNYAKKEKKLWPYYLSMISLQKLSYKYMKQMRFIVTSPETNKELRYYGIKKQWPIIFNGFELKKQKSKKIPNFLKTDKTKLLFVGRFHPQKNLFNLLKTFKQLKKMNDDYILTLAGDGSLKKELKEFVKRNNIQDVYFTGHLPQSELIAVYKNSDYLVLSSAYEGFPLTLSEGLGYGLVPLLSPITIFKYIREKISSGIIIDFNKPTKAAYSIDFYSKKIDLKKESEKTAKKARKLFDWNTIARNYLALETKEK